MALASRVMKELRRPVALLTALGCSAAPYSCLPHVAATVPLPCGGRRAAAAPPPRTLTAEAGDIVGVVQMPWRGPSTVRLDGHAELNSEDGTFVFQHVTAGRHVLVTRAIFFEPQYDTVYVPAHGGVAVWIRPQRYAVCLLGG
jgi:hypothetical protein